MSKHNHGNHSGQQQRAAEISQLPAHIHEMADEHRGKQDHQTGQEHSRQFQEHGHKEFLQSGEQDRNEAAIRHEEIAALAHEMWVARGCPQGSAEEDWLRAVAHLASQKHHGANG